MPAAARTLPSQDAVGVVQTTARAATLLKPVRIRILNHARTPASATTIAARLKLSRQRVNYHVRALAQAGFLKKAGRQRKRGCVEQRYVISAEAFLLAPDVLGAVGTAAHDPAADRTSAAYLLALAGVVQREVAASARAAGAAKTPMPVLTLDTEFRFTSAAQRARFAEALATAVTRVVAEHTTPITHAATPSTGRTYRLAVASYPLPQSPL